MRFHDIFLSFFIILLFTACFMLSFLTIGFNKIKNNWVEYRCNPIIMPFASFFGHDTVKNFSQCIANVQSSTIIPHKAPLEASQGVAMQNMMGLTTTFNKFRKFNSNFRPAIAGGFSSVLGVFQNLIIELQRFAIGFKDLTMKILGIMTTVLYMTTGQSMLGSSIIKGPFMGAVKTVGDFCFHPSTPIKLSTGETIPMKELLLGDELEDGDIVNGILKLKGNKDEPYYKLWSNKLNRYIWVTGSHKILNGGKDIFENYIEVKDYKLATETLKWDNELSCLITSTHRIKVGEHTFWDWED